jgi:S-adenosylmethionine-diacylglycerol 3-amino-3-carboxypropyl transferase
MARPAELPALAEAVDFSIIRYAQCWEDAEVLLAALDVQPGDVCVSIASGGDNTLALLTADPARVIAVDLSAPQIWTVELKGAAYRHLPHAELLEFLGAGASRRRIDLYQALRDSLSPGARTYWDRRTDTLVRGLLGAGRFEAYFRLFRTRVLPLIHRRRVVEALFEPRDREGRERFYRDVWDTWRWRLLSRLFLSRFVMGRLGRDPSFFRFVEGGVAERILARVRSALVELDPGDNPYLQWIALGRFARALPVALRPEHHGAIRQRLDRLELRVQSLEHCLASLPAASVDRFNLSDVFEYISTPAAEAVFDDVARAGRPGGRAVHWNMLVPRYCPPRLAGRLRPLPEVGRRLHPRARACFYSDLVVEAIQ